MRHSYALFHAFRTSLLAGILLAIVALAVPAPLMAQTVIPVAAFKSVTLRNGGSVILRHGPTQRVTLVEKGRLVTTSFALPQVTITCVLTRPHSKTHVTILVAPEKIQ